MTAPLLSRPSRPRSLAEVVAVEQKQVEAGAAGCGKACDEGCHGNLTCVRIAHPHDPEGDVVPHFGYAADGSLTQWTCFPSDHDGLTDETRPAARAAAAAAVKADATRALLDTIDPKLLVQMLKDGGHL